MEESELWIYFWEEAQCIEPWVGMRPAQLSRRWVRGCEGARVQQRVKKLLPVSGG